MDVDRTYIRKKIKLTSRGLLFTNLVVCLQVTMIVLLLNLFISFINQLYSPVIMLNANVYVRVFSTLVDETLKIGPSGFAIVGLLF